jgi:hypothetical protein
VPADDLRSGHTLGHVKQILGRLRGALSAKRVMPLILRTEDQSAPQGEAFAPLFELASASCTFYDGMLVCTVRRRTINHHSTCYANLSLAMRPPEPG